MSPTGIIFSYAIGAIFALGGLLFIVLLDDQRFLFGIPYLLIGLLLVGGTRGVQRRRARQAQDADAPPGDD